MISVIICSTNPQRLARVKENISSTIGCEHEFVVRDNKSSSDGICKVYNELADEAQYDLLCFVHEDVEFCTSHWGEIIAKKAVEPKTGIIGFVGSAAKTKTLSGVSHKYYNESNVTTLTEGQTIESNKKRSSKPDFTPAITIDGLCLMMSRTAFEAVGGFDQKTYTGFHLYDLDISTAVTMAGFTNYICHSVDIIHYSRGDYTYQWYQGTLAYHKKWGDHLPLYITKPNDKQIKRDEDYILFNITYLLLKRAVVPPAMIWPRITRLFKEHPFTFRTYYLFYRYVRYKFQYKNQS